jgi:predicted metalloprotease
MGAGGGGIGLLVVIALVFFLSRGCGGDGSLGIDPIDQFPQAPSAGGGAAPDADAKTVEFVDAVMGDVQDFWTEQFSRSGRQYERAKLVLFTNATQTACGVGSARTGPFYCPLDRKAYVDLSFFRELERRFGAPGDFAQAYVLAHEIGHHVQNLLGINDEVRRQQEALPESANDLSVRLELQADCFAGVWAFTTYERNLLESGDLDEGLDAAAAVGDDRIQQGAGVDVDPETWTHGSAEQRVEWFRRGFEDGDPNACDTFSAESP